MELPSIKETAPSASGYPTKDYTLKLHEMSSLEYRIRHIDKDFLREIAEIASGFCTD